MNDDAFKRLSLILGHFMSLLLFIVKKQDFYQGFGEVSVALLSIKTSYRVPVGAQRMTVHTIFGCRFDLEERRRSYLDREKTRHWLTRVDWWFYRSWRNVRGYGA